MGSWSGAYKESGETTAMVNFATEDDAEAFCAQNGALFTLERSNNEVLILGNTKSSHFFLLSLEQR